LLRVAVFDPIAGRLGDCRRLVLAPDGALTVLPFSVLPTDDGNRLIDDYKINYVTTGRDVLRFGRRDDRFGNRTTCHRRSRL